MLVTKKTKYTLGFAATSCALLATFQNFRAIPGAQSCSAAKVNEVLEGATPGKTAVKVNCSMKLNSTNVITKQVVIEGAASSGVVFNCNGATLESYGGGDALLVRSKAITKNGVKSWERPENITVSNCKILGGVRVYGMAKNGEGVDLRDSSRQDANHTKRVQANAPKNIIFEKLKIASEARIAFYVSPGVTYLTLKNSAIEGSSPLAIYLDAESGYNSILNNSINTLTDKRELIAVDGSANNLIQGNKFSSLSNGGIYLYRNCGEGGTIRHQAPQKNQILDNIFYYKNYKGSNPSIYLGARNGGKKYCGDDAGFSWGSSANDGDFARNNIVTGNKIYVRGVNEMIISSHASNTVSSNYTVTPETVNNPVVTPPAQSCKSIPVSGACSYDVGKFGDGQRGGVKGYYKLDNKCNYSVRVVASKIGSDSGYIPGKKLTIVGDRGYKYTAELTASEFVVRSSGGQQVCQINR